MQEIKQIKERDSERENYCFEMILVILYYVFTVI